MGFDGKSIDKHHISIFILLFVYWVNNAYLFEISRFHYKERAYICMCMYVYVYMYVYMYICVFRSDPIRFSDPIPNNCSAYSPAKKRPSRSWAS